MTTTQPQPTNTPTIANPGVVCTFHHDGPFDRNSPRWDTSDQNPVAWVAGIGCEFTVWVSMSDPADFTVTVHGGPMPGHYIERVFVSSADVPYPMAFAYVCSVVVAMVADDVAAEMSY